MLTYSSGVFSFTDTNALFGATTAVAIAGNTPQFQIHGTSPALSRFAVARWTNNNGQPSIFMAKSRGTTVGSHTAVSLNDLTGALGCAGSDGTEFIESVSIRGLVDGTVSTGIVPSRLALMTTTSTGNLTNALVLDKSQNANFLGAVSSVSLSATSTATILRDFAIPAGGSVGAGYMFSSTSSFGTFFGSGAPTLTAAKGSLYLRSDGSTSSDRAYINIGTTTWTAVLTAA